MGDCARFDFAISICEAEYIEQRDISLVVLPGRSLDEDERVSVGLDMEIIALVFSR